MSERIPVIVDCDPGHDDVFALWLAAGDERLDLRAVTAVAGNGRLAHTERNARIALSVAGVADVPVAAGANGPLVRELATAEWIHGENGLGGPDLPEPSVPLDPRSAVELMADVISASADPVAIIATGPITNVAMLLRDRPDVVGGIREIVWMEDPPLAATSRRPPNSMPGSTRKHSRSSWGALSASRWWAST